MLSPDGKLINNYSSIVQTPLGRINPDFVISAKKINDNQNFKEGDEMWLSLRAESTINVINLPIFFKYYLFNNKKRTKIYLKAGGIINYTIEDKLNSNFVLKTDIQFSQGEPIRRISIESAAISRNLIDIPNLIILEFITGIGFESKVKSRFSIFGEIIFQPSSVIYQDESSPTTRFNSIVVSVGGKFFL